MKNNIIYINKYYLNTLFALHDADLNCKRYEI